MKHLRTLVLGTILLFYGTNGAKAETNTLLADSIVASGDTPRQGMYKLNAAIWALQDSNYKATNWPFGHLGKRPYDSTAIAAGKILVFNGVSWVLVDTSATKLTGVGNSGYLVLYNGSTAVGNSNVKQVGGNIFVWGDNVNRKIGIKETSGGDSVYFEIYGSGGMNVWPYLRINGDIALDVGDTANSGGFLATKRLLKDTAAAARAEVIQLVLPDEVVLATSGTLTIPWGNQPHKVFADTVAGDTEFNFVGLKKSTTRTLRIKNGGGWDLTWLNDMHWYGGEPQWSVQDTVDIVQLTVSADTNYIEAMLVARYWDGENTAPPPTPTLPDPVADLSIINTGTNNSLVQITVPGGGKADTVEAIVYTKPFSDTYSGSIDTSAVINTGSVVFVSTTFTNGSMRVGAKLPSPADSNITYLDGAYSPNSPLIRVEGVTVELSATADSIIFTRGATNSSVHDVGAYVYTDSAWTRMKRLPFSVTNNVTRAAIYVGTGGGWDTTATALGVTWKNNNSTSKDWFKYFPVWKAKSGLGTNIADTVILWSESPFGEPWTGVLQLAKRDSMVVTPFLLTFGATDSVKSVGVASGDSGKSWLDWNITTTTTTGFASRFMFNLRQFTNDSIMGYRLVKASTAKVYGRRHTMLDGTTVAHHYPSIANGSGSTTVSTTIATGTTMPKWSGTVTATAETSAVGQLKPYITLSGSGATLARNVLLGTAYYTLELINWGSVKKTGTAPANDSVNTAAITSRYRVPVTVPTGSTMSVPVSGLADSTKHWVGVVLENIVGRTALSPLLSFTTRKRTTSGSGDTIVGVSAINDVYAISINEPKVLNDTRHPMANDSRNKVWQNRTVTLTAAKQDYVVGNIVLDNIISFGPMAVLDTVKDVDLSFDSLFCAEAGYTIKNTTAETQINWRAGRPIRLYRAEFWGGPAGGSRSVDMLNDGTGNYGFLDVTPTYPGYPVPRDSATIESNSWYNYPHKYPTWLIPTSVADGTFPDEQQGGNGFEIMPNRNAVIVFEAYIPPAAPTGVYTGTLYVNERDTLKRKIPISVTVRNVTLPDTATNYGVVATGSFSSTLMQRLGIPATFDTTYAWYWKLLQREFKAHYISLTHAQYLSTLTGGPYDQTDGIGTTTNTAIALEKSLFGQPFHRSGWFFDAARGYDQVGTGKPYTWGIFGSYDTPAGEPCQDTLGYFEGSYWQANAFRRSLFNPPTQSQVTNACNALHDWWADSCSVNLRFMRALIDEFERPEASPVSFDAGCSGGRYVPKGTPNAWARTKELQTWINAAGTRVGAFMNYEFFPLAPKAYTEFNNATWRPKYWAWNGPVMTGADGTVNNFANLTTTLPQVLALTSPSVIVGNYTQWPMPSFPSMEFDDNNPAQTQAGAWLSNKYSQQFYFIWILDKNSEKPSFSPFKYLSSYGAASTRSNRGAHRWGDGAWIAPAKDLLHTTYSRGTAGFFLSYKLLNVRAMVRTKILIDMMNAAGLASTVAAFADSLHIAAGNDYKSEWGFRDQKTVPWYQEGYKYDQLNDAMLEILENQ